MRSCGTAPASISASPCLRRTYGRLRRGGGRIGIQGDLGWCRHQRAGRRMVERAQFAPRQRSSRGSRRGARRPPGRAAGVRGFPGRAGRHGEGSMIWSVLVSGWDGKSASAFSGDRFIAVRIVLSTAPRAGDLGEGRDLTEVNKARLRRRVGSFVGTVGSHATRYTLGPTSTSIRILPIVRSRVPACSTSTPMCLARARLRASPKYSNFRRKSPRLDRHEGGRAYREAAGSQIIPTAPRPESGSGSVARLGSDPIASYAAPAPTNCSTCSPRLIFSTRRGGLHRHGFSVTRAMHSGMAPSDQSRGEGLHRRCRRDLAAVNDKTRIVFVANPNNPTGT